MMGRFLSPDNYVQEPDNSQNFNRYSYCLNNPLKYTDPNGEIITWNIGKHGISFGLNFGFWGFGVNIGWDSGGSVGFYGEIGPRVGGTGFGAGVTISQSLSVSLRNGAFSTATSAGVYGSLGLFNVGANGSYTYGNYSGWNWGVSAGINIAGNDERGFGLNVGYGADGFDFGIGGYYDPDAWDDNPEYNPVEWNEEYHMSHNNCYSYALNDIDNGNEHGLQPGYLNGVLLDNKEMTVEQVAKAAISDGRIKKPNFWNKLGFGKKGYYSVYLVAGDFFDNGIFKYHDYHWYRQDKGGLWSHKPGGGPVRRVDASRHYIKNPARANHYYKYGVVSFNYNQRGTLLWVKR
jgi:hypothetical protein